MKSYNNEAHRVIKIIRSNAKESNMVKFGKCCISTNDGVIDRPVREAMRTINEIESEKNYLLEKILEHYDLIDKEARNAFSNGLIAAVLNDR